MNPSRHPHFVTTRWSIVLRAGDSQSPEAAASLEELCRAYWYPLYAYARFKLRDPEAARDATQDFFVDLLARKSLGKVVPEKGRFRGFLLGTFNHHLNGDWRRSHAEKRGGKAEIVWLDAASAEKRYALLPPNNDTPERLYDRSVARAFFDRVLARLDAEYRQHPAGLDTVRAFVNGDRGETPQTDTAARAGMTLAAFKIFAFRVRRRWAELAREEVADLVDDPADIEAELLYLAEALR